MKKEPYYIMKTTHCDDEGLEINQRYEYILGECTPDELIQEEFKDIRECGSDYRKARVDNISFDGEIHYFREDGEIKCQIYLDLSYEYFERL